MSTPPPLLIGVDGGGTGCRAVVGSAAQGILGEAQGGPGNVNTDFDAAIGNIMQAVLDALAEADLGEVDLANSVAHMGLAGADLPETQERAAMMFPFGETQVSGDRQTTVAGVLGERDGYVVALGTGTIIARQQAGRLSTVSGWGFALSDEGSGATLGRTLLARTINAAEGLIEASNLTRAVVGEFGGVQGIFEFSTTATPGDYARFAPKVFAAARQGDKVALALLNEGAAFIEKGLRVLGYRPGDHLCLAGGVGPHYAPYLAEEFTTNLQKPAGSAAQGAFTLARLRAQQKVANTGI